ncbi:NAD(P)/FAD-dependent oxidoreductase [Kibdelosporangium phytohabitans]|uniref:FAD-binding monooxygenase n=1 Tax=Kibdelosporangium phytohabitans TaxID=860235 RepID=A0A0N9I4U6_9PSEU|nr:NAD(P)/FAD-dependent oxidoreductase [Kibdelosporangium phytohabitans]ALG09593.1 FAD-binding monooxygenase [Kibdelosporangium phytohabitans]MBE1469072.1 flavin-dependent dehydrogenase [Kibdelosporangium phytohabitans]
METADVLVIGAGLAGLRTARLLAQQGLDVLVCERRSNLGTGIRTTGIFVRRTLSDFTLPARYLGPAVRRVVLYPPSLRAPVELVSPHDEFRVGDMPGIYAEALAQATQAGAVVRMGVSYPSRKIRARFTIGADGARSTVARRLGLDVNKHLIIGAEKVFGVNTGGVPTFHCVVDPRLAPGYLAWLVDDGQNAHAGLAGRPDRLAAPLPRLLRTFMDRFPEMPSPVGPSHHRGGPIPVGGVLRRIVCTDGLLVGDAAGAVSPLTAGGLDPCLRMAELAASVTCDYLRTSDASVLRHYDGASLRARFRVRLLLRDVFSRLRRPATAEAAFTLLRTPSGRAAAARILFGDGSFPAR